MSARPYDTAYSYNAVITIVCFTITMFRTVARILRNMSAQAHCRTHAHLYTHVQYTRMGLGEDVCYAEM